MNVRCGSAGVVPRSWLGNGYPSQARHAPQVVARVDDVMDQMEIWP
jgi:hypothetical protein